MTAAPALSLETVRDEIAAAAAYAAAAGLTIDEADLDENNLRFVVTFVNARGDRFPAEFDCRDYPAYPPTIEFLDEARTARGLASLYPKVFHPMPCVCARFNRKAYGERGGPHGEWRLVDWQLPTGNGVAVDSIAMMLSDLHSKIVVSAERIA
jgi:hypothetical protein